MASEQSSKAITLQQLAGVTGATLRGPAELTIQGVAGLDQAGAGSLSFLADSRRRKQLADCQASALILREDDAPHFDGPALITANPYAAWAKAAALFARQRDIRPGIHASAVVAEGAQVDASACIGPLVTIGQDARIGCGTVIEAGAVINEGVVIGEDCHIGPRVVLHYDVVLGNRVQIHAGAVIGAAGFGLAFENGRWLNIPQLGTVRIGDDCEIGANTTIDRGALGDTVLEEDVRLDNQIQIGHNVTIGAHTAMAGCVGVAGSATIGKYVQVGGASGIGGHITIADKVVINSMTQVVRSISEPGVYSAGLPMSEHGLWKRNAARFRQLDQMAKRLNQLEKRWLAAGLSGDDKPAS
jgi:UDP-3-O-[3-hydroxymyristoyl] glucosamine N-acyltransferase